ncbi:FHA domain-containing protein [Tautonia sp. JC769]|uniref:FHA domain-containing protein n=1 Tax=Tautonia sp. JC769 TaxID=3232135 RepID=UPI00345805C9
MNASPESVTWLLEVVRGREVGRRYPVRPGRVVLGNAPGGAGGIDLSEQEVNSLRKMAARHAALEVTPTGVVLVDLESPGGVFLNRRRVLPGKAEPLDEGDVIQLGGLQLRMVRHAFKPDARASNPPPGAEPAGIGAAAGREKPSPVRGSVAPARPSTGGVAPLAFPLKGGAVCRGWDDFITVSAQRWEAMRDELTSGRLASYLISAGRGDLAPRADAPGSPDDRLDAWLGAIPTSKPSHPELEVHPRTLRVKARPGATTRQTFRVSNVGYRLLRSRVRVEPEGVTWLRVASEHLREFTTIDETEVVCTVVTPDPFPGRLNATVVVESNGGGARVAVVVEAPTPHREDPEGPAGGPGQGSEAFDSLWEKASGWLEARGRRSRILGGAAVALLVRLAIGAASGFSPVALLPGPAAVLAVLGGIVGGIGCFRRGGVWESPSGVFAGGFAGVLIAAILVACCQATEPLVAAILPERLSVVVLIWGVFGAMLGAGSLTVVPERRRGQGGAS